MKPIELSPYDHEFRLTKVLFLSLVILWVIIGCLFVFNRVMAGQKDVAVDFFYFNEKAGMVGAVLDEKDILSGDEAIVKAYLGLYVREVNESLGNQNNWLREFSTSEVFSEQQRKRSQFAEQGFWAQSVRILDVERVSDDLAGAYKVRFFRERINLQNKERIIEELTAVLYWRIRKKTKKNPLGMEIYRYIESINEGAP